MNENMSITNCPNCGAPVEANKCSCCGTYIFDFSQIKLYKPCWISVDFGDGIKRLMHVRLREVSFCSGTGESYYADGSTVEYTPGMPELSLEFDAFPKQGDDVIMISKRRTR